jgi:hypothetical protein
MNSSGRPTGSLKWKGSDHGAIHRYPSSTLPLRRGGGVVMERVTGHIKLVQRKRGPQWYVKYRANGTFRGVKIERLEIFGTRRDALEAVGLRE